MARTIEEGFRDFLRKLTPTSSETNAAKQHRESIRQCIESNFGLSRFWRIGSFGNGTSISGHSDVDYMASIPYASLHDNSSTSLTTLRNALATRFPNTSVRTSCPAVVVPFGTDAKETTEITPAHWLRSVDGFHVYGIPDCSGKWMDASPDAHNDYVRSIDDRLSYKLKPLIRFVKAWKYFQNVPISSFYLELRVAKYASSESSILYSIDIKKVFELLDSIALAQIRDPKGISGLIAPCGSATELLTAKSKLTTALSRVRKAREAEASQDIRLAFEWWNKLFCYQFPSY